MAGAKGDRVTVLLVDDHAVVREGYRRLLERHGDIVVIGEAADATEAHALFRKLAPQIVVMDITLPGLSGIEAMRRMLDHEPDTRVLIFSMHEDAIFAKRALQAGAFGYVTKASAPSVLVEAVHTIAGGKKYLSAAVAQALALLHGLLNASDGGEDAAIGHLYMLARTFRQMLIILEKNVRDSRAIWAVLWQGFRMPPFAAEDLIRQARRYNSRAALTRALRLVAKADAAFQTEPFW